MGRTGTQISGSGFTALVATIYQGCAPHQSFSTLFLFCVNLISRVSTRTKIIRSFIIQTLISTSFRLYSSSQHVPDAVFETWHRFSTITVISMQSFPPYLPHHSFLPRPQEPEAPAFPETSTAPAPGDRRNVSFPAFAVATETQNISAEAQSAPHLVRRVGFEESGQVSPHRGRLSDQDLVGLPAMDGDPVALISEKKTVAVEGLPLS